MKWEHKHIMESSWHLTWHDRRLLLADDLTQPLRQWRILELPIPPPQAPHPSPPPSQRVLVTN